MKLLESIKLRHRANKYKNKDDKGGIAYINSVIQHGHSVLDIGAHKAGYLYWMRQRVGKNGKVFAFEPQTFLYRYIRQIKALFKWDNVIVEHVALSDEESEVTLYIPVNKVAKGSSPGATIVEYAGNINTGITETVHTQTLDAYCRQHTITPHFLKIDVEGSELKVFKGGIETLKKYKPKILVEIEARHVGKERVLETFEFLKILGYKGYIVDGVAHIPLTGFEFEIHQNMNDKKTYCNNFIFE